MIGLRTGVRAGTMCAFIALIFLAAASSGLSARTMYLSPSGGDGAACVQGATFKTFSRAAGCLEGGDTLIVLGGSYEGGVVIRTQATEEAPLVIRGQSLDAVIQGSGSRDDAVRVDGASHVVIERLTVRNAGRAGISILNSHHVRVTGCRCVDNGKWGIFTGFADDVHFEDNECCGSKIEHGIYHSNSGDRFVIRNNRVHDNAGCGIHMNGDPVMGGDGVLDFGVVEGNVIWNNGAIAGGAGINMTHVQDVIVRNNLLYNNRAGGFTVYRDSGTFEQGSKRVLIMGNTLFFSPPRKGRACVNIGIWTERLVIVGNILVSGGYEPVLEVHSTYLNTIRSDRNIYWGIDAENAVTLKNRISLDSWRSRTGNDKHTIFADPLFVAPGSGDFSVADSSPAVDAAMPLDSVRAVIEGLGGFEWMLSQLDSLPEVDIIGAGRPAGEAPDAGAYEMGAPAPGSYDFNRDGGLGMADVITLLVLAMDDMENRDYDINGDGNFSAVDVIRLLLVIRNQV
ncbi:MAG: right-handed parallel beta-helix repeat-containing protein [Gemmatimonadota bacterium]|nr:right-handed parallel beta-helix repeat-containing protein [Gemmatimonadota bacterium]